MADYKFRLDNFQNPPEKVRLMFEAVIELAATKADMAGLKVQDITARAGIGKGTAYEYFSSKEELITLGLLYDYGRKLTELKSLIEQKQSFSEIMYCLMDWFHDNSGYHMTFVRMIQLGTGNRDLCDTLQNCVPVELLDGMHTYLLQNGDAIMEMGYQEHVFSETDIMKRRMAFATMLIQLILTLGDKKKDSLFIMEYEQIRDYAYQSMVKMLT